MLRRPAEGKALAEGRLPGQVKVLPLPFIEVKHLQGAAALPGGIDVLHIGVFLKNLLQPCGPNIPHRSPEGDGHGGEGIPPLPAGECRKGPGHQPAVKGLSPGGEKIKAVLLRQHQVDDAGLGQSLFIQGGKDHRMDLRLKDLQYVLWSHGYPSLVRIWGGAPRRQDVSGASALLYKLYSRGGLPEKSAMTAWASAR